MTESLDIMPKTTEQKWIARIGKSEAKVTNNKILWSRYYTIEANCSDTTCIDIVISRFCNMQF